MIVFLIYLAVFIPCVYVTNRLRALRGAKTGYLRFQLLVWGVLFALGFAVAPVAALCMLVLLGVAVKDAVKELRYRNRQVQYLRGNGPAPEPLRRKKEDA